MNKEELQKQAQKKLSEARKLICEAGELAKEGQFFLNFGEIGCFIPRSMLDRTKVREEARLEAMKEGMTLQHEEVDWSAPLDANGARPILSPRTFRPWEDLNKEEQEELVEEIFDEMWSNSPIPYEFREYAGPDDGDRWWHPSRC